MGKHREFSHRLKEMGIEPIAVLPLDLWLCIVLDTFFRIRGRINGVGAFYPRTSLGGILARLLFGVGLLAVFNKLAFGVPIMKTYLVISNVMLLMMVFDFLLEKALKGYRSSFLFSFMIGVIFYPSKLLISYVPNTFLVELLFGKDIVSIRKMEGVEQVHLAGVTDLFLSKLEKLYLVNDEDVTPMVYADSGALRVSRCKIGAEKEVARYAVVVLEDWRSGLVAIVDDYGTLPLSGFEVLLLASDWALEQ